MSFLKKMTNSASSAARSVRASATHTIETSEDPEFLATLEGIKATHTEVKELVNRISAFKTAFEGMVSSRKKFEETCHALAGSHSESVFAGTLEEIGTTGTEVRTSLEGQVQILKEDLLEPLHNLLKHEVAQVDHLVVKYRTVKKDFDYRSTQFEKAKSSNDATKEQAAESKYDAVRAKYESLKDNILQLNATVQERKQEVQAHLQSYNESQEVFLIQLQA